MMCFNKVQAARLGTKVRKPLPEASLCPVVTSGHWPTLAHGGSGMMPLRQQAPFHKLPDLCLLSLTVSLSAKSDYVFGIHAVTLRCKQVSHCPLKTPSCSSYKQKQGTTLANPSSACQFNSVGDNRVRPYQERERHFSPLRQSVNP